MWKRSGRGVDNWWLRFRRKTRGKPSAGWAQTYRIQNWRLVSLWTMDSLLTPILNSVRPSLYRRSSITGEVVVVHAPDGFGQLRVRFGMERIGPPTLETFNLAVKAAPPKIRLPLAARDLSSKSALVENGIPGTVPRFRCNASWKVVRWDGHRGTEFKFEDGTPFDHRGCTHSQSEFCPFGTDVVRMEPNA
jgi:hypothetical protein